MRRRGGEGVVRGVVVRRVVGRRRSVHGRIRTFLTRAQPRDGVQDPSFFLARCRESEIRWQPNPTGN